MMQGPDRQFYFIIDSARVRAKVISGEYIGYLVSRGSNSNAFLSSEQKESSVFLDEIEESFKSVTFEQTVSKILALLNRNLESLKAKNTGTYMAAMKDSLVICKKALENEVSNDQKKTKLEVLPSASTDYVKKLYDNLKHIFDGVNRKSVLSIDLTLSIISINEALKLMGSVDNCIVADPWRFDTSKLRQDALTCRSLGTLQVSNNFLLNEFMKTKVEAEHSKC